MKNPFKNNNGRFLPENTSVISFAEDVMAFAFIILLTVSAIVIKIMQDHLHLQVLQADAILVNIGFVFACVAGVITWRENKHLSLAAVTDKLPPAVKKVVEAISDCITPMILVQFFLSAFCQFVNPAQFDKRVLLFFSERFFFFFFPLCYLAMVIMAVTQKKNRIPAIIGLVLGVLSSTDSITGILQYLFGLTEAPHLLKLTGIWNLFCAKTVWPVVIILIALAFAGVPLFVVISGITYVLFSQSGVGLDTIILEAQAKLSDKSVTAIPLFTIAGYVLAQGSAGKRFVNLFNALFGWFRGGTVVATVLVLTFFSTFTGVSGVTILALGGLLSIILVGSGYDKDRAESLITSSGALGLLFPPSVAIIMYATSNYTVITQFEPGFDVTNLFVAALIPGAIMALAMIVMGIIFDKNSNRPKFSIKAIGKAFKECAFELLLPVLICITYFSGFFNLFQVASFAVIYTFCLAAFIRKDFTIRGTGRVIADSVPVSGGVLFIIAAAAGLSYFMTFENIPELVTEVITTAVTNKYVFLILMNVVLLIVGCLMDLYSAILIISPLLLYASHAYGIPVVQAGVIFLMNLSIGFLTPPVGMDLFISSYAFKKPVSKVIKGVAPFLIVQLVVLMLVTYVPALTTALVPKNDATPVTSDDLLDDIPDFTDDDIPDFTGDSESTGDTVIIDGVEYQF
ncbi:TRAP transporter large permease subunit [Treponema sp.]|uniref:TRAP transporter large permease n=1 Tax=Treponema sp. TaxID=166 RepID=UPI00298E07D2|nr:TRAP transporter large permease subunit [Treponema sp.]